MKEDYADYNDEATWDIIVPGVFALARQGRRGLYNPYEQDEYHDDHCGYTGPCGSEWKWGPISNDNNLNNNFNNKPKCSMFDLGHFGVGAVIVTSAVELFPNVQRYNFRTIVSRHSSSQSLALF